MVNEGYFFPMYKAEELMKELRWTIWIPPYIEFEINEEGYIGYLTYLLSEESTIDRLYYESKAWIKLSKLPKEIREKVRKKAMKYFQDIDTTVQFDDVIIKKQFLKY